MVTPDSYTSATIRPIAEAMQGLDLVAITGALIDWNNGMSAQISNDDTLYDDGRAGIEGVKGSDIWLLVTQMQAYQMQMMQAGVRGVIAKPCVRTPRFS